MINKEDIKEDIKKDINIEFGEKVRELRQSKNLSIMKCASLSELHATYLQDLEKGHRNPTLFTIYKLSKVIPIHLYFTSWEDK